MIGQQHDELFVLCIPDLQPSQDDGILFVSVEPFELNELIAQDVPVGRNRSLFHNPVTGIALLAGDEENPALVPGPKEREVDIALVHHHDRTRGEVQRPGDPNLVDLAGRDTGKHGQIAVMIQQQVKLHGPLGSSVLGPVKQRGAQRDDRGIEAEEPVLEPELPFAELQLPAAAQDLIKQLLVELPGTMLVRVGQGRAFRDRLNAQMPGLAETTGQAPADLPKGMGLPQLAEHHGHELVPATEPFGVSIRSGGLHGFKELASRK